MLSQDTYYVMLGVAIGICVTLAIDLVIDYRLASQAIITQGPANGIPFGEPTPPNVSNLRIVSSDVTSPDGPLLISQGQNDDGALILSDRWESHAIPNERSCHQRGQEGGDRATD